MKKTLFAFILALLLLPAAVQTVSAEEVVASGSCGDAVTWTLDSAGTLTISGEGDMRYYTCVYGGQPWREYVDSIEVIRVEGTVNSIGNHAFSAMDHHTLIIGEGVTKISNYAFWGCSDMTKVVIPDSLIEIGSLAFSDCHSLTCVELGPNVASLDSSTFYSCGSLTEIRVSKENPFYSSDTRGVLYDKEQTTLITVPGAISGEYIIPEGVTAIDSNAFYSCDDLTRVVIPDSVTSIGTGAFSQCTSLTDVELGNGVVTIGGSAFSECVELEGLVLPDSLISIGGAAFHECDRLTRVVIPDSVTTIGKDVFSHCNELTSVELGSGLTSLGGWVFEHCYKLREILFRGPVPTIGKETFYNINATVYYPPYDTTWTEDVMQDYGGIINWVPWGVAEEVASGWSGYTQWRLTADGVLAFYSTGNMKNYEYSGGQPWADYADQITSVIIREGVTAVGDCAFKGLTKLESVTLPETGLTRIGEAAFYGCTALKEITIPEGIYTVWSYTFKGCSALETVKLPRSLIKLDQGAFENCTGLNYIYIPTDTQIIGSWSFKGCTGLTEAEMTWADAREIREGAFKNCTSLTTILLPDCIQTLGDSCFYGIGAKEFTVPATVTSLEAWCFARASLEHILFEGDAPAISEGAFNKITLSARYPAGNPTWTAGVMQNYGGTVTWTAD